MASTASNDSSPHRPPARPRRALQRSDAGPPAKTAKRWLPAVARRALPVVTRSAAGLAVGFAVDYAMRALARRAVSAANPSRHPAATPATPSPRPQFTRHIVTEVLVVERSGGRR